ncbi:MAG TPA: imelysin family protein [Cytophagaceae bacterium]|jgi:predicted lipoprotein|nr:imelysin family protein [Cytophagaceae bacterium]
MKLNHVLIVVAVGILSLGTITTACKKKAGEDPSANYNRTPLLTNIGNNIIVPNYQALATALNQLDSGVTAFKNAPDATSLSNVQELHKAAYKIWQRCTTFDFGPATDNIGASGSFRSLMDTYPADVVSINSNIAKTPDQQSNLDAVFSIQGFPAVDYLLFGTGTDNTAILAKYTTATDATNRFNYLSKITSRMKDKTNTVLNTWLPTGGNYINTFISNNGTDAASSMGLLMNQFVQDYDNMKYYKMYVPLNSDSSEVEAFYSGISSELIQLELKASQKLYLGQGASSTDTIGFDDYLIGIDATRQSDGTALDPLIKAQYISAVNKMTLVPDPLAITLSNNRGTVLAAYGELQRQLPLIKQEMPAAMGILISYGDNDGD